MPPSPFLSAALEAAERAAPIIMRHFDCGVDVMLKADQSPVTVADREAEAVIIDLLRSRFPVHGFLGEESGESRGDGEHIWIIDPVDGTKNFIHDIPIFGTEIALWEGNELRLGVSNLPAMGECLYAERGCGAFLNGRLVTVSKTSTLADAHVSFGGLNHFPRIGRGEQLLAVINASSRARAIGDAYAYHLVASGRFDAVIEASVRIWDVAAACAIIAEAGGRCTDLDGKPIGLASRTIVASNGLIHDQLLRLLQSHS